MKIFYDGVVMECSPLEAREFFGKGEKIKTVAVSEQPAPVRLRKKTKIENPWTDEEIEILVEAVLRHTKPSDVISLPVLLDRHTKGSIYYKLNGLAKCDPVAVGKERWKKLMNSGDAGLLKQAKENRKNIS